MGKTTILGLLCLGFAGCASDEQRDFYDGCRPEVGPPRAGCPDQGTRVETPDVEADVAPSIDASVLPEVGTPEDAATPPDAGPPPGEGIGGPCVDPTDCQSGFCLDSSGALAWRTRCRPCGRMAASRTPRRRSAKLLLLALILWI